MLRVAVICAVVQLAGATSVVHTHNIVEGQILAEELLDSAMMTMRTTADGEKKLDDHPSLYQQYLAKLKAETRRLAAAFQSNVDHDAAEAMAAIKPKHELKTRNGPTMRSYGAADGAKMAEAVLAKHAARKALKQ